MSFTALADGPLSTFGLSTVTGLNKNPDFKNLPVPTTEVTTLVNAFNTACEIAAQGGKANTAAKNAARAALIDALRQNALYVEIASKNDRTVLLSSGYQVASTNRAQSVLEQVQVAKVTNPQSGQLKVRIVPVPNARSFEGRIKPVNGSEFGPSISFASTRRIIFDALTAGVTYTLQLRAIGGSTGYGDWSAPTSHMPT